MKKERYQAMIWTYKQRRLLYKTKNKKKYANQIRNLTKKIAQWQCQIRRFERRENKINDLIQSVDEYFGVDIRSRKLNQQHKLARNVYYKFGIENNFRGTWLSSSIGRTQKHRATESRMSFTRSFETNKENRNVYATFKRYQADTKTYNLFSDEKIA